MATARVRDGPGTSLNLSPLRINTLVARYLFFRPGKYVDYIAGAADNVSISLLHAQEFVRASNPSFSSSYSRFFVR